MVKIQLIVVKLIVDGFNHIQKHGRQSCYRSKLIDRQYLHLNTSIHFQTMCYRSHSNAFTPKTADICQIGSSTLSNPQIRSLSQKVFVNSLPCVHDFGTSVCVCVCLKRFFAHMQQTIGFFTTLVGISIGP